MIRGLSAVAVVCCLICMGAGHPVGAQELPDGMIGYWTFDEVVAGAVEDLVGSNDGALNGPVAAPGMVGGALDFDGVNDWVDFGTSPDFAIYPPLSIEAWIYPREGGSWVISKGDSSFRYFSLAFLAPAQAPGSNIYFWVESAYDGEEANWVHRIDLDADQWHHVVGVHDGQNVTLYVDGHEMESKPAEVWNLDSSGAPLTAGIDPSYFGDPDKWFNGLLDEMAIYDRALTFDEIEAHYYNGQIGLGYTEPGMDSLWLPSGVTYHAVIDQDEVAATELLPSQVELGASVNNWSRLSQPVLRDPQLDLETPFDVVWLDDDGLYVPGSEYTWQFPDLEVDDYLAAEVGLDPSVEPTAMEPGFSIVRSAEGEIVGEGGLRTVHVTLELEDDELDGAPMDYFVVRVWGEWDNEYLSAGPIDASSPNMDCDFGEHFASCIDWDPAAGRVYDLDVTFDVSLNEGYDRVEYMPSVNVQSNYQCCNQLFFGTSAVSEGPYGTWTYSSSEVRFWHTALQWRKVVSMESRVAVLNHAPVALCQDVYLEPNVCEADVSIDAGSYDPDGDPITLEQDPPGSYGWWTQSVYLNVTDSTGARSSCSAQVIGSSTDNDDDGWVVCHGDCDDQDPDVNPGLQEICDGKDNNCNGEIDEGLSDQDDDGWPDCLDNCQFTPNSGQEDWNGDGVGDACQDFDEDGLLDETEIATANDEGCPFPDNDDSDSDTLLDGAEADAGTDPCSSDTDDDGVDDAIDPLPTVPGVDSDWLAAELRTLSQSVRQMDLELFEGRGKWGQRARRTALAVRFHLASKFIGRGREDLADLMLQKALLRLDGATPPKDFMPASADKTNLLELTVLYMELLELM